MKESVKFSDWIGRLRGRGAFLFWIFVVLGLQIWAIEKHSLVWDAPYHLVAGYQALEHGTNTLNLEHPPLLKMIAAAPLASSSAVHIPFTQPDSALQRSQQLFLQPEAVQLALHESRLLLLGFSVIPFFLFCFLVGREVSGIFAGALLLLLCGLSFAVVPYLTIITTDAALAAAALATVYFALRFQRRPGWQLAVGLGFSLGLALAVKFSGVLLFPTVICSIIIGWEAERRFQQRLAIAAVVPLVAFSVLAGSYCLANRGYEPGAGWESISQYVRGEGTLVTEERLGSWEDSLRQVHGWSPSAAQWLTGFLGIRIQNQVGVYPSYALGAVTSKGRWWYFPLVFLLTTPVVLLVILISAVILRLKDSRGKDGTGARGMPCPVERISWRRHLIIASFPLVYLGFAIASNYNLGGRHLLPIIPFIYLPAAAFLTSRRSLARVIILLLALESFALGPLWMSSTNTWWLGKYNPTLAMLGDSSFDYGQNWRVLADALKEKHIENPTVVHPVIGEGELNFYLKDAHLWRPGDYLEGRWVVQGVIIEQYLGALATGHFGSVYNEQAYRELLHQYEPIASGLASRARDHGLIAGTFRLYELAPGEPLVQFPE